MEVLSQDEINQLLTAIAKSDSKPEDFKPKEIKSAKDNRKIKIYDFKRPDKFSKLDIRMISIIHETFARLTKISLSAQLQSMVNIQVASVDQLAYNEFIRSVSTPTTLAIIDMNPLKGNVILEIDPDITFVIIDRICGGIGEGTKFKHELMDIETSIMENIIVRMLSNLREAWTTVLDLRPRLGQIDTIPENAMIVPNTEMTVLISFETEINNVKGFIGICIPYLTIEPIMSKITSQFWYSLFQRKLLSESEKNIFKEKLPVRLTAELLRRDYSIKEIWKWDIGTVILPLRPLSPGCCYLRLGNRRNIINLRIS